MEEGQAERKIHPPKPLKGGMIPACTHSAGMIGGTSPYQVNCDQLWFAPNSDEIRVLQPSAHVQALRAPGNSKKKSGHQVEQNNPEVIHASKILHPA